MENTVGDLLKKLLFGNKQLKKVKRNLIIFNSAKNDDMWAPKET